MYVRAHVDKKNIEREKTHNRMEDKLFQYYNNELSAEEVAAVEAWIEASEENKKIAQQIYWLCYANDSLDIMQSVDSKAAFRKVEKRIASARCRKWMNNICRVAAVLLLPVAAVAIWALSQTTASEEPMQYVELRTTSGMVSSITLPDSSRVWLNSNSYLKYPVMFNSAERRVELVGEGYFKVAKNEEQRFIVKTSAAEVEVMGTEFNVDAYDKAGRDVQTTLVKGSINLTFVGNDKREHLVQVYPGQRVTIDPLSKDWSIKRVNTASAASWKEGRIVFDKTPFAEALRMIENRFNVEFVVKNPKCYEHNFTGMFTDQRLDVILEHFRRSSRMRFVPIDKYGVHNVKGREIIEVY